jgi:alpha-L-fucosidase
MKTHKTQTAPKFPMLWIFEGAHVGQASRLSSNDIRPQARRPHYLPEAQKRSGFGISARTIIAASLFAVLPMAFAKEEAPKVVPKEESLESYNNRMQWFVDSPYGMFIHFGLYSTVGGMWQGKPIEKYAEWIQGTGNIDRGPQRRPGMNYLVITAKHHEGFCLWDSQYTEFDVASTPFKGRDLLEELRQACDKYGIKFGLYYSIIDWNHPTQKRPSELGDKAWPGMTVIVDNRKQEYVDYQKNQVLELIKKYDPAVLWFDGDWAAWWTMPDGIDLYNAIREASPHVIVNNRVAKRDGYELDFVTQEQGHFKDAFPKHWEGCYTMNKSWGYKKNDNNWKDGQTIYNKLKDINEKGGNLLLNVGPDGNGVVQPEAYAILRETAELLKAKPIHKKTPQITAVPGVIEKQAKPAPQKTAIDGAGL